MQIDKTNKISELPRAPALPGTSQLDSPAQISREAVEALKHVCPPQAPDGRHLCLLQCAETFGRERDAQRHIGTCVNNPYAEETRLRCPHVGCGIIFRGSRADSLKRHLRNIHDGRMPDDSDDSGTDDGSD